MDKKAQAALEFLTTYGWAILVILVMIGALVYFGLLNPTKALPNRCDVTTGFICKDFIITERGFEIQVSNKLGESIKDVALNGVPESDEFINAPTGLSDCAIPSIVAADAVMVINCNSSAGNVFEGLGNDQGVKVKVEFEIIYTPIRGTYNKTMSGTIYGPVQ